MLLLLFVDSAGEGSEETAVQNECHATSAHRGGVSVGPHEHISTAGVFNFFHLVCPASSGLLIVFFFFFFFLHHSPSVPL
jgi:hypothetical protein